MDGLLSLPTVNSHHDVKGLRRLYDAHVRGQEITTDSWEISDVLTTIDREVAIQELTISSSSVPDALTTKKHKSPQTASALLSSTPRVNCCIYCNNDHLTNSCDTVKDFQARKDILRRAGRYYICLRRNQELSLCSEVWQVSG